MKILAAVLLISLAYRAQAKNATLYVLNDAVKTVSQIILVVLVYIILNYK